MATAENDDKCPTEGAGEERDKEGLTASKTKDISSFFVKEPSSKKQKVEAITISHVRGDLFKCPDTESLVHCVSKDLHMGKGIATLFKQKFGGVQELKDQRKGIGDVAILERDGRYIYYLITKERYFHKPTYKSLEDTLVLMRKHCAENDVTRLSMPKIGCGLDKLEWNKVEGLLKKVFLGAGVHITVYSF